VAEVKGWLPSAGDEMRGMDCKMGGIREDERTRGRPTGYLSSSHSTSDTDSAVT
jgi:hypothetical protein